MDVDLSKEKPKAACKEPIVAWGAGWYAYKATNGAIITAQVITTEKATHRRRLYRRLTSLT